MVYHSTLRPIILPEYGRHIQQMVDSLMLIEDKEIRSQQAQMVIDIMGNLFPYLRDVQDFRHKLWAHLFAMAEYSLDINAPYSGERPDVLTIESIKVPYIDTSVLHKKHFGRLSSLMILHLMDQPESKIKDDSLVALANFMKRSYLDWNKENVTDQEIFDEITRISKGKLEIKQNLRLLHQDSMQFKTKSKTTNTQNNPRKTNMGKPPQPKHYKSHQPTK